MGENISIVNNPDINAGSRTKVTFDSNYSDDFLDPYTHLAPTDFIVRSLKVYALYFQKSIK